MKYFDVHTHTNSDQLEGQAREIIIECQQQNINFVDIGTNVDTSLLAVKHANESKNVYACVGIHPNDITKIDVQSAMDEIELLLNEDTNKRIVAIGETGLDHHYYGYDAKVQEEVFISHIKLAHKYSLPLMVHIRDAHEEALRILKEHAFGLRVIIHCFTGNSELVTKYVAAGYYISINGVITFKSADDLKKAIPIIPPNRLLSETDAPWLSPAPNRGKVNTPLNIVYVVEEIAKLLNKNVNELAEQLFNNAIEAFDISF